MTNSRPNSVDEYISSFPEDIQAVLQKVRRTIKKQLPGSREAISYGMPAYYVGDKGYALVYFSGWKEHVGLYPAYEPKAGQADAFEKYRGTKNSLHIPFKDPFPYEVVEQFVQAKLKEQIDV